MHFQTEKLSLHAPEGQHFIDITDRVTSVVRGSGVHDGHVLVFVKHTTCGLRICENEERLLQDKHNLFEKLVPKASKYLHDDIHLRNCPANERVNGHAHLKSLLLNTSEIIPVSDGKLMLGRWQHVFLIELDGAREREVVVQILGEKIK